MEQLQYQLQPRLNALTKFLQDKLPADRNQRLLLFGSFGTVTAAVLFPLAYHYYLGRTITHTYPSASSRYASQECGEISSFPPDFIENYKQYNSTHDKVVKHMPNFACTLSPKHERLFTEVVKQNMLIFSRTPQALIFWFSMGPDQRRTFTKEYIDSLKFHEGDVVCGIYQVVKRTDLRIEFAMLPPKHLESLSGLKVISWRPRGEGSVLVSETVHWVRKDTGVVLPLTRWGPWLLHSITSRYLILASAKHMQQVVDEV